MMQYTESQLEKAAFYGLCKHYDFLHEYSDDHRAWQKGMAQWQGINDAVLAQPELRPILQAWAHYWTEYINRNFQPEPQLGDFL